MPHSTEAEQSVIGAMLMDASAVAIAADMLVPEDFYQKQYAITFEAMVDLYHENQPVDLITLQNRLRAKDVPPEISSLEFVRDIINTVPTSANVRYYAQIVSEKSQLRQLIRVSEEIEADCYAGKDSLDEIKDKAEEKIFQVLQRGAGEEVTEIKEIVLSALERIEEASRSKSEVTGVASGFADLDAKTNGFQKSDLIVIAARPSMGKTAFALNIAEYMAFHSKLNVVFFSLEMSKEQLVNRLFSMESRINSKQLRTGRLEDSEWASLVEAAGVIGKSNLIIDDTSGITLSELRSRCRKYKLDYHVDVIMLDYMQLIRNEHNTESRQQEVSEISRTLKGIARELDVPFIVISQLSRAVEQRNEHRPMLSDLRDSGAIEQDADLVMFLYREDYYDEDSEKKNVVEVNIAKQRNGEVGTLELAWLPDFTKFANMKK